MKTTTRRSFIKAAGVTAGATLAASYTVNGHAQDRQKLRLGLIGGGERGQQHLQNGLWNSTDFDVVAVADVYRPHRQEAVRLARLANAGVVLEPHDNPDARQKQRLDAAIRPVSYQTHSEMLAREQLDAVAIATPPHSHANLIIDCLDAGLHVFCETPLASNVADARRLVVRAHETDKVVQVGHQRRYHPNYNLVVKHLHDRYPFGRPTQSESYWHQNSHWRRAHSGGVGLPREERELLHSAPDRFINWRLFTMPNGGPCLDVLPRSMDTTNWFCGGPPTRVYVSGGIDYWNDGRTTLDNLIAVFDYVVESSNPQFVAMEPRYRLQDDEKLNDSYKVRSSFSFTLTNGGHREHERIISDRASATLNPAGDSFFFLEAMSGASPELREEHQHLLSQKLAEKLAAMTEAERQDFQLTHSDSYDLPGYFGGPRSRAAITAVGSEESPEVHQFRAFARHIREGGTPRANVMVGLAAVVAGESAYCSLKSGQPVDIDPALMDFEFDTPSITEFDTEAVPIPGSMEVL